MAGTTGSSADATAIRPFTIPITPEAEIEALRARIAATRWPERETLADPSQGVQLATMQALARYWASDYDLRRFEARLNALPQFITEIDGLDIHFLHLRSPHEQALPLAITHGWPGSVIEQLNVVGPLTDPTAHGGDATDAFDVVVPSMPGTVPAEVSKALASNVLGAGDPPPSGPVRRRTTRLRAAALPLHQGHRLCTRDGVAPPDPVRARRLTGRPGGLDAGPRRPQIPGHLARLRRRPSSTRPRGAGPSGPTPTSSTSTRSTGATTSRPGRSRSCSPPRSGPRSGPCVDRRPASNGGRHE